ncbi:low specificity L-threonine aldolase [Desulfovibrio sp. OttesenSCG-928-M16]|nr:low specificity L-threonine aldolase [Desulfovibrio sp. OttesenSCG-928-M16]
MKFFASDNNSGVHPLIIDALEAANVGNASSYGDDEYTQAADAAIKRAFGPSARPWFVFLGTAANVLGLKSMVRSHQAVICSDAAHIHTDECGAPEAMVGCKLITIASEHGKIRPLNCLEALKLREAVHHNYPKVLSVTQATECGTLYSLDELKAISRFCQEHDLYFHMDGARLCNAAAAMGLSLRDLSTDVGVDVLSFGGTKNGLMFGELVVFLNDSLGEEFAYLRKQNMQLISKMRFMAAQFLAYLRNDLWRENANQANTMAALLASELENMDHVRIVHPVQVNAVFARLPEKAIAKLNEAFYFYTLDRSDVPGFPKGWHLVRLMTSFNTTPDQVLEFVEAVRKAGKAV